MERIICRVIDERVTEDMVAEYLLRPISVRDGGVWVPVSQVEPEDLEPNSRRALFD